MEIGSWKYSGDFFVVVNSDNTEIISWGRVVCCTNCLVLGQVLWDRNPGFLKSEIGPFSDFKRKSYLMDLKSAHSQESDFQESGEVDRFLKMGTHFQERSGSLENGLCVTWSGFWLRPWYLCGF